MMRVLFLMFIKTNYMFKDDVKNWFKKNLKPTQTQFHSFFDRIFFKDEKIPIQNIENIDVYLNQKADKETFENHINSDLHLTEEQKNALENLNTGCFHFNGHTLKMCNVQTKFNDVLLKESDRAVIFLKIPNLRVSNIRGHINLGILKLYDIESDLESDFPPRKLTFETTVFSKIDWEEYTYKEADENLDFITSSKVVNDESLFPYGFFPKLRNASRENNPENLLESLDYLYTEDEEPLEIKVGSILKDGETKEGVFIYLPKDIYVLSLKSVFASLDELEITFLDTTVLDLDTYKNTDYLEFYNASELTGLISYEVSDNVDDSEEQF